MAVPSAVIRQRERLEAELKGVETPPSPPVETPVAVATPAVPEVPTPPSTPTPAPAADLAARVAELEQLLRSQNGRASTTSKERDDAIARNSLLESQVTALESAVAELTKQKETAEHMAAARSADADLPSLDDPGDLSPAELEVFGTDSASFVKKLSKRELIAYVKPLVNKISALEKSIARLSDLDKLPQLETAVKASQEETSRMKEEDFFRKEVLAYFSDFESVRDTQEWKDYLATDIPGRGIKIGHLLHTYRTQHNASGIRSVLQGYYDQRKDKPALGDLAVPGKSQTEGTVVVKPRMKASEYKSKLKQFVQKKITKADWDNFKTEFDTAYKEERVDMDERL